jgi:hypothetical protein
LFLLLLKNPTSPPKKNSQITISCLVWHWVSKHIWWGHSLVLSCIQISWHKEYWGFIKFLQIVVQLWNGWSTIMYYGTCHIEAIVLGEIYIYFQTLFKCMCLWINFIHKTLLFHLT